MLVRNHTFVEFEEMRVDGDPVRIRIEHRVDPFFPLYTTTISDVRVNKPGKLPDVAEKDTEKDKLEKGKCYFEPTNIHQTPKPRFYYDELEVDGYVPVSVPNKFGFSLKGLVNCFTSHEKKYPKLLTAKDWRNYLVISEKNAHRVMGEGYSEMFNVINFGHIAGGSQAHPHFQDGVLLHGYNSRQFRERDLLFHLEQSDDHPFQTSMNFSRKMGLNCFENDSVFIAAPYAPMFPDQVDLTLKPEVSNLRQLTSKNIKDLSLGLFYTVNFLSTERGVTDFNVIAHQDSLTQEESGYRLHFHVMPRNKNIIAGVEIGSNGYVVDTWPEATAAAFREYIGRIPEEER